MLADVFCLVFGVVGCLVLDVDWYAFADVRDCLLFLVRRVLVVVG